MIKYTHLFSFLSLVNIDKPERNNAFNKNYILYIYILYHIPTPYIFKYKPKVLTKLPNLQSVMFAFGNLPYSQLVMLTNVYLYF